MFTSGLKDDTLNGQLLNQNFVERIIENMQQSCYRLKLKR